MADSMRDIKGRIKSVSSTKQITHAMQLVASAKLRRTRERADARRAYTKHIIETMHVIASGMDSQGENVSIFLKNNDSDRDLFVVIASDKGLAGGFNSNVLKYAVEKMAELSENPMVMAVGVKSVDFFTRRRYEIAGSYTGESENPSLNLARNIGSAVNTMFIEQKVNRYFFVPEPVKIDIEGCPDEEIGVEIKRHLHPDFEERGERTFVFEKQVYIPKKDYKDGL